MQNRNAEVSIAKLLRFILVYVGAAVGLLCGALIKVRSRVHLISGTGLADDSKRTNIGKLLAGMS